MKLAKTVMVLSIAVILLVAAVFGLGTVILEMRQGHDIVTAVQAGFTAAGTTVLIGCAVLGTIAVLR
ncbi:hypothetical protein [Nocardia sp. NPDC050717]|uniref:hypothetical protein n=1 Tax=Nocardia sp. NPDC050717 TaxID=3157221 RepID=UPI00340150F0